jgi:hypothetical protein
MNRQIINPHWLHVLLYPLAGLADVDEAVIEYRSFDPNEEEAVRRIIREQIVPYFARVDAESVSKIKQAYRYYLSKGDSRWDRVYDSMLLPFDHPDLPRDFFLWIWQECFPNEDWQITDLSQFEIEADVEEPLRTMKLAPEGMV